jgi:hypothetical protein
MKRFARLNPVLFAFLVLCLSFTPLAHADVTAAIFGVVHDPAGNVVPGATVTLTSGTTGYKRSVLSGAAGEYEFISVPVGEGYAVEVTAKGFDRSQKQGITLLVNQRFRAEFTLAIGDVAQEVSVSSADNGQVDTSSNQLGDVIGEKKILSLPLNGRSYTDLLGLQPGVVPVVSAAGAYDRPVSGGLSAGGVSVNGSQESGNSFLINGGDVEEPKDNGASVIPTLDSIQEFRVLTNTFDAEYGRFGGAIVNVITKSGTNKFHGSAYEFLRNEKLNAKNYFDQDQHDPVTGDVIPNSARGVFKRSQFGFTFGGPIMKDRLFFFSDYQGTRQVVGQSAGLAEVPSVQEKTGDFSDVATTGYSALTGTVQGDDTKTHSFPVVLSQRLGYTVTTGEPYWVPGCTTSADAISGMCVFPNQVIPKTAWDSAAVGTIGFITDPNRVQIGSSGASIPVFSTTALKNRLNDDKLGEHVTWNERHTGDWSVYFTYDTTGTVNPYAGGNVPGFSGSVPQKAYQANINNTRAIGSTMANEVRLNYTRSTIYQTLPSGSGLGPVSQYGFPSTPLGLIPSSASQEGVPQIGIYGSYNTNFGVVGNAIDQVNNNYQAVEMFSKILGKHSLKFGGEYRQIQVAEFNISSPNGYFGFYGGETGNGFADYLIGAPNAFVQQSVSTFFTKANYSGFFAQDAFRLRPDFTINAGLRWEYIQPFFETQNRLNAIDFGVQSTKFPGSPTGWIFPGDAGLPNTIAHTQHDNFSPRLGVNWSPSASGGLMSKLTGGPGKSSIRAGSGLFYTAVQDQPAFFTVGDAPFGLYYSSPTQVYFSTPFEDRERDNDPGQRFPFTPPKPGATIDWSQYLPIGGSPGVALGNVTPYIIQFNVNVQRELPRNTVFTAAFVGSRGHHLFTQLESNPGIPSLCLATPTCGPYGEDQIYPTTNGTRIHSVTSGRFLSQGELDFSSNTYGATIGNSSYNSFQMSLSKHVGLAQFLASYTFSKSIDDSSGAEDFINPVNAALGRGLSAFDTTQNFVVSYQFDLPKFQSLSPLLRGTIGGWELSGITRATTGQPIQMSESGDITLLGTNGIATPNYDGLPIKKFNPRSHAYFDTSRFSLQALGTLGSSRRRFFHGPGIDNTDVALKKFIPYRDHYSLELRAEFFNVFNHASFYNPDGNISDGPSFGVVTGARDPRIGQLAARFSF